MKILVIALLTMSLGNAAKIESDQNNVKPLDVGGEVKSTMIQTTENKDVDILKDIINKKQTVLVIYRGGWCPYCMKQLARLRKVLGTIQEKGYQLVAVSPDSPESIKKAKEKNGIDGYELYSDSKLKLASQLGLAFKVDEGTIKRYKKWNIDLVAASGEDHQALPVPAVYILDKSGKVKYRFYEIDYARRLDEKVLIENL